jgi:hypothetical protein
MNIEPRRFPRTNVIRQAPHTLINRVQTELDGAAAGNDGSPCMMLSRCSAWSGEAGLDESHAAASRAL